MQILIQSFYFFMTIKSVLPQKNLDILATEMDLAIIIKKFANKK